MSQQTISYRIAKVEERQENQNERLHELRRQQTEHAQKTHGTLDQIHQELAELGRNQERVLWVAIGAFGWYLMESVGLVAFLKALV